MSIQDSGNLTLEDDKRNLAYWHQVNGAKFNFFQQVAWNRHTTHDIPNIISERRHQIKVFKVPCAKQGHFYP